MYLKLMKTQNFFFFLFTSNYDDGEPDQVATVITPNFRTSRPEVFCKNSVIKNFSKFTIKHLHQSLFFNKVAGFKPATLLKKRLWHAFL